MPAPKSKKKVLKYSQREKLTAVRLSEAAGVKVKDVAAALDIHPFMLSWWRKEAREGRLIAVGALAGLETQAWPAVQQDRQAACLNHAQGIIVASSDRDVQIHRENVSAPTLSAIPKAGSRFLPCGGREGRWRRGWQFLLLGFLGFSIASLLTFGHHTPPLRQISLRSHRNSRSTGRHMLRRIVTVLA